MGALVGAQLGALLVLGALLGALVSALVSVPSEAPTPFLARFHMRYLGHCLIGAPVRTLETAACILETTRLRAACSQMYVLEHALSSSLASAVRTLVS